MKNEKMYSMTFTYSDGSKITINDSSQDNLKDYDEEMVREILDSGYEGKTFTFSDKEMYIVIDGKKYQYVSGRLFDWADVEG